MGLVQLLAELGAARIGVLAEQGQGALVLAGGVQLEIDVLLAQEAVEVGQLRHHADRADDGERRRHHPVGDAGHQVAAAGGDLVHRHRQAQPALADAAQLRGRQAVAVDHAAGALQAQQHLVLRAGHLQQGADLLAQGRHPAGFQITVEIQHK